MQQHLTALHRLTQIPGVDLYAASAGVNYSHRSAKGNRYLRRLLCQIAWAAIHTKDTFFAGLFARLKPRVQVKGAAWAVAHRIAKIVWLVLPRQVDYQEKGPALPNERWCVNSNGC